MSRQTDLVDISQDGVPAPFAPVAVTGTTPSLNVGSYNFFNQNALTGNTTVSFTSVPTNANWKYSFKNTNSVAWNISYASLVASLAAPNNQPHDITFKPDGTEMYILGNSNPTMYQLTLSTAWDITTATATGNKNISSGSASLYGLDISTDGLNIYTTSAAAGTIEQYTLGTAWDITTATLTRTFSTTAQDGAPLAVAFKPDGLKMYMVGNTGNDVNEYNLSTAWNISTAVYSQVFSLASQTTAPIGLHLRKTDGLKMYIADDQNETVLEYTLSTGWDVSTATYVRSFSVSSQTSNIRSVFFTPVGDEMYITGSEDSSASKVYQYGLADYFSITLPSSVVNPPTAPLSVQNVTYDFFTMDGGTTVNLIGEEIV